MLVLERTDVEFIVVKMYVEEALEKLIVDDVVSDKFEVGVDASLNLFPYDLILHFKEQPRTLCHR